MFMLFNNFYFILYFFGKQVNTDGLTYKLLHNILIIDKINPSNQPPNAIKKNFFLFWKALCSIDKLHIF